MKALVMWSLATLLMRYYG